jgi:bacterial/archaeal transporter family-2 protein
VSGSAAAAVLCVVAGFAGSIQVAVMARLGDRVGIPEALAFATVLSAALAVLVLIVLRWSLHGFAASARQPPWLWLGALMSLLIVFTITLAGARIGTAATIGIIIAGQLVMAALIDRFGLFGADRIGLGWPRLTGLALLAAGAALSLRST